MNSQGHFDMTKNIKAGSVVQANELADEWAGTTLIVSDVRSWGVQAYLKIPYKGLAFIRLTWSQIEYIGEAPLVMADVHDSEEEDGNAEN